MKSTSNALLEAAAAAVKAWNAGNVSGHDVEPALADAMSALATAVEVERFFQAQQAAVREEMRRVLAAKPGDVVTVHVKAHKPRSRR